MDTTTYSSTMLFSSLVMIIFFIIIVVVAVYYIAKKRVAKVTAQAMKAHDTMQQALTLNDRRIVALDLSSDTFYNVYGHQLPADGLPLSMATSMVHPDDLENFAAFIERLRKGEKQEDTLRYRFNVNYQDGEPIWNLVCNHAIIEHNSEGQPSHIIFTMANETEEKHTRQLEDAMADKYRLIFEDSIIGISFYNADGYLIDCNKMMRDICQFESRYDPLYYESCIFDFAQFNINRNHVEESWLCINLEMTKRQLNKYLEVRVHPINDNKGKLKYIAMAVRDVTEERGLYLQSKLNNKQIQKANDEIRRYEEQLRYLLENSKMHVWHSSFDSEEIEFLSDLHHPVVKMTLDEFSKTLQTDENETAKRRLTMKVEEKTDVGIITRPFKNLLLKDDKVHWYDINSIPSYNDKGEQTGYFGLIRDITRLIDEQEQLKRETERANDSDRMKSVFLANMTHEIRTPLNAIVGFSDLLQAVEGAEEKREMMRIIRNNCDILLRLINDFLAISSIESNGLTMSPQEVDFAREFDDFCESLAQRVTEPVKFIKENPYATLLTTLDKDRIGQVITNFVTNAVKYTQQGHIRVGYKVEEKSLSTLNSQLSTLFVYCEDTGSGIPKEAHERIFERFVKLNDYVQGTGLGLSISKAIVEACGGQIGVESEVGKGSTFWFWIPCDIKEVKP